MRMAPFAPRKPVRKGRGRRARARARRQVIQKEANFTAAVERAGSLREAFVGLPGLGNGTATVAVALATAEESYQALFCAATMVGFGVHTRTANMIARGAADLSAAR